MKINVFTKNIVVEPKICKDQKDKFKIILRYPNTFDSTKILLAEKLSDRVPIICDLFIKFENKPILTNEDKKELEYKTLKDMLDFGGRDLYLMMLEVLNKVIDILVEAKKVEKKP